MPFKSWLHFSSIFNYYFTYEIWSNNLCYLLLLLLLLVAYGPLGSRKAPHWFCFLLCHTSFTFVHLIPVLFLISPSLLFTLLFLWIIFLFIHGLGFCRMFRKERFRPSLDLYLFLVSTECSSVSLYMWGPCGLIYFLGACFDMLIKFQSFLSDVQESSSVS